MTISVRQFVEKVIEHRTQQYLVFVELMMQGLWIVGGILADIIRPFHEDMEARIRFNQALLEKINVNNGLCQGCTMVPPLFNLYACAVVKKW